MKAIIELNNATLEKAEIEAAKRGVTLSQLVTDLLEVHVELQETDESDKTWMNGFGELADLAEENQRILNLIESEFGVVDENDSQ